MAAEQQVINYGASANDGTGDPLRTAFIKTDDNFDAIWAAGPVGSNVTIANNTIGISSINGNLILAANGVGSIQTSSTVLPRLANTYDLGSADARYRSAFVGVGGVNVTGNITGANVVAANLVTLTTTTTPVALANLVAMSGRRAFVSDSNLSAAGNFGAQIAGGGANTTPVWSDGTNWYIG